MDSTARMDLHHAPITVIKVAIRATDIAMGLSTVRMDTMNHIVPVPAKHDFVAIMDCASISRNIAMERTTVWTVVTNLSTAPEDAGRMPSNVTTVGVSATTWSVMESTTAVTTLMRPRAIAARTTSSTVRTGSVWPPTNGVMVWWIAPTEAMRHQTVIKDAIQSRSHVTTIDAFPNTNDVTVEMTVETTAMRLAAIARVTSTVVTWEFVSPLQHGVMGTVTARMGVTNLLAAKRDARVNN
jgi:hypothetical protein